MKSAEPPRKPLSPGRGGMLHRVRTAQQKAAQAETTPGGVGHPKPRKPSMPQMPWDKKDAE